jgi:hypothetical protein
MGLRNSNDLFEKIDPEGLDQLIKVSNRAHGDQIPPVNPLPKKPFLFNTF